jgi:hypothetical protein
MAKKNPRSGKKRRKEKAKEREKYWNAVQKAQAKKARAKKVETEGEGA